ncbi:hypothetical protein BDZ91DRAFT_713887 [Kalaharituber pfeilii]|nr:hypothetical protein BDZ91DRAFT_713887 [Kalaharituber pfeilii]
MPSLVAPTLPPYHRAMPCVSPPSNSSQHCGRDQRGKFNEGEQEHKTVKGIEIGTQDEDRFTIS